jgi:hypothetical protein
MTAPKDEEMFLMREKSIVSPFRWRSAIFKTALMTGLWTDMKK